MNMRPLPLFLLMAVTLATAAPVLRPTRITNGDPHALEGAEVRTDPTQTYRYRVIGMSADGTFRVGLSTTRKKITKKIDSASVDEFLLVRAGREVFTSSDGTVTEARAGDAIFMPKGWQGLWETDGHEEFYAIYDGAPASAATHPPATHPIRIASHDPLALATPDVRIHDIFRYRVLGVSGDGSFRAGLSSMPERRSLQVEASQGDEFLFVVQGSETFTSSDGSVLEAKAGDAVFLPKGWKGHYDTRGYQEFYAKYGPDCTARNNC
jgi:uncharacterized cupin superfamily protein